MALAPGLMQQRPRGLFGAPARIPQQQPAMTATEQPMKKGFDWGKLIGVLGDSLSIAGGGQAQYVPNLIDQRNRQQAQAYAEQAYQRRRGDTLADQRALLEYKRANPDPDYFDDNAGNRWSINPSTGEKKLIFRDPNAKRIPQKTYGPNGEEYIEYVEIPNMVNEDGTVRPAMAPQAMPQRPKGKLTPYNGGQTAIPSGNF
ncbi:hypothetical protein [Sphingopyxis sp. C-1]|uniref:hypothetical protein n=1 Tax=Sphingopyxis sp. C-1 TaxID=262667 RepID=UPI0007810C79|nr:hypothetical protein [Sphingopyxis sp. C-1]